MKLQAILCLQWFCLVIAVSAQSALNFDGGPEKIEHHLDIFVSDLQMEKILEITGSKISLRSPELAFDGDTLEVKSCRTRGNTTLLYPRKSFAIHLKDPITLQQTSLNRMAVNNLAMDQNYWRNRVCFILMQKIGIFPLINKYVETRINTQTQGVYLMLQTPEDFCRSIDSPLLLRRENDKSISTKYENGVDDKRYLKQLKHIRTMANHSSGRLLMDTLNAILDVERYFRWLSFNYLIMNGDYTDELFFFLDPDTNKLHIIPWDYDDVFKAGPHEGSSKRDQLLGDKLIFSSETTLDKVIAKDRYLYEAYQKTFLDILVTLTDTVIQEVFEQVYQELTPYYLNETIISQSRHDMSGRTDLEKLQSDLNHHFQFLIRRRRTIYETLMLNR